MDVHPKLICLHVRMDNRMKPEVWPFECTWNNDGRMGSERALVFSLILQIVSLDFYGHAQALQAYSGVDVIGNEKTISLTIVESLNRRRQNNYDNYKSTYMAILALLLELLWTVKKTTLER